MELLNLYFYFIVCPVRPIGSYYYLSLANIKMGSHMCLPVNFKKSITNRRMDLVKYSECHQWIYDSNVLTFGYNPIQYDHKTDYKSVAFADFKIAYGSS